MRSIMIFGALTLAGCQTMGGGLSGYPTLAADTTLSDDEAYDREDKCKELAQHFEDIDRGFDVRRARAYEASWELLSNREKHAFAELSACDLSNGEIQERIVTIYDQDDRDKVLANYRVENRVDWMKVDRIRK